MKRIVYVFLMLTIGLLTLKTEKALASHASGGEIIYEWISDSTYRFFFKFYRDCTGIQEPNSQVLCFTNTCNNTTFNLTLQKWTAPGNGNVIQPPCLGLTKCSSPTSFIPGFREWIYFGIVAMPSQCSDWVISTVVSDRNPSLNLNNATAQTFYVETHMNNVGPLQGNNSPYFVTKPLQYFCLNQPTIFNNLAVDPDGDSLYTEMVLPRAGMGCTMSSNVAFAVATPPYAIPNNPMQTNNTFTLQGTTGQMSFTPSMAGTSVMALKVSEYRNGVLIGTVVREMEAIVLNCTPPPAPPTFTVSPSGVIHGCPLTPVSFCFTAQSANTSAVIKVYDNHNTSIPGSNVVYTGNGTDSVVGCFNWTPPANTFGNFILQVTVVDSTCNGSMPTYNTFSIPIVIGKTPSITITASPGTYIGMGDTVTFAASTTNCNNGTYQWKKNGVDVPGATASTWITNNISNMDTITCALHCNDTCSSVTDTISNEIVMHVFSSVKGMNTIQSTELFPNPNNGAFILTGFAVAATTMHIEIVNTLGQVVWANSYKMQAGPFRNAIQADNLSNGMYLLRIRTNEGTEIKRMTINK